jgi:ketosteroid isomerase-like protein
MSQENVELARRYFEAFDANDMNGTQHLRHPEMEVFDPPNLPDSQRYVGEGAIRRRMESFLEIGWDGRFSVQEYLDAGEEVVVVWRVVGRTPHGGGVPLDVTFVHVCLFEAGQLRRVRQYLTRAEALEAAGLSE